MYIFIIFLLYLYYHILVNKALCDTNNRCFRVKHNLFFILKTTHLMREIKLFLVNLHYTVTLHTQLLSPVIVWMRFYFSGKPTTRYNVRIFKSVLKLARIRMMLTCS